MYARETYICPIFLNHAYQIGWIIAGSFAIVSTITSLWLINKHLRWYTYVCILYILLARLLNHDNNRKENSDVSAVN
jgi:hypothetical protein